jgi:hypothetical protein
MALTAILHSMCRLWIVLIFGCLLGVPLLGQNAPPLPPDTANQPLSSSPNSPPNLPLASAPNQPLIADVPKQKPGELYRLAMQPLDVVRSSLDNWSDAELAALAEGMRQARLECDAAKPEEYAGDDLYDLARLCALGQDWNATLTVAQQYIASGETAHRARAYAMAVNALIQTRDLAQAVEITKEMLGRLPFDAVVAESAGYLTTYLEQGLDPAALELATELHPLLIDALGKGVPLRERNGNDAASLGGLYEEGMLLAFLQRYAGEDEAAVASVAELKGALAKATAVSADDLRLMQAVDARYGLLGAEPPAVEAIKSVLAAGTKAKAARVDGLATVYVLFPQWCPQCRRMMKQMTVLAHSPAGQKFLAYGLMMQATREPGEMAPAEDTFKDMSGTSTMLVAPGTAAVFGATEFPLGVVMDKRGKVRFVGAIPSNAFDPRGLVEEIVNRSAGPKILLVRRTVPVQ